MKSDIETPIKQRAERNRTIQLNNFEKGFYLSKCLSAEKVQAVTEEKIKNKIINGDTFEVLEKFPINLLIC